MAGCPRQRFWLEITDREDIGVDLHCTQRDSAGSRSPGFSLIWWIEIGDINFHYNLDREAITSWSRAAGHLTSAPTPRRPHRSATRRRLKTARPQPGWWLDLDSPFPLRQPLTITQLTDRDNDIREVLRHLQSAHRGSSYFPFFWWGDRQLRPMQPHLNKLPAELIACFPRRPRRYRHHYHCRPQEPGLVSARSTGKPGWAHHRSLASHSRSTPPCSSGACAAMPRLRMS